MVAGNALMNMFSGNHGGGFGNPGFGGGFGSPGGFAPTGGGFADPYDAGGAPKDGAVDNGAWQGRVRRAGPERRRRLDRSECRIGRLAGCRPGRFRRRVRWRLERCRIERRHFKYLGRVDHVTAAGFPAPFREYEGEVLPAWIDSNDHMNLAYYVVLFDHATDVIYAALGMGPGYKASSNCGTFAVETHILYDQELRLGERVRVTSHVLGADAKRLHLGHEMHRISDGARAAAQELMYLHIDLDRRRVTPWTAAVAARLQEAAATHAPLRPDWVGRRIAMPRQ